MYAAFGIGVAIAIGAVCAILNRSVLLALLVVVAALAYGRHDSGNVGKGAAIALAVTSSASVALVPALKSIP